MTRRKMVLWLVLLVWLAVPLSALAAKDYRAERFDMDVAIQTDGSVLVTQTIVFRFSGGPFTYAFQEVVTSYTDGVTDIAASMDGDPLPPGKEAGQVEIRGSNPIRVTWHFAPTSDSTHTFVLTYRARGVIRQEPGADRLLWQVISDKHDYPIDASRVTVTYPARAVLLDSPTVTAGQAQVESDREQVIFTAAQLGENDPLQIELRFAPGSLISVPPQWQASRIAANRLAPLSLVGALALLLGGSAGLAFYTARAGRRSPATAYAPAYRPTTPPAAEPPALAGVLASGSGEVGWAQALGTLFDLGRRGVITIEQDPERKWYRRYNFTLRLLTIPDDLRPHERGLLELLFSDKRGRHDSLPLSELSTKATSQLKKFTEPLKEELRLAGVLSPERKQVKNRLIFIGIGLMISAALVIPVLAVAMLGQFGPWPLLFSASLFMLSLVAFVMGGAMSALSDEASQQALLWKGFADYLKTATKGKEIIAAELFEAYLPYAAAFGLAEPWVKYFQKQGVTELPAWFHALAAAGDEGMAAFAAMITASHAADGSAAGAGAAGAAGSGASGAG